MRIFLAIKMDKHDHEKGGEVVIKDTWVEQNRALEGTIISSGRSNRGISCYRVSHLSHVNSETTEGKKEISFFYILFSSRCGTKRTMTKEE